MSSSCISLSGAFVATAGSDMLTDDENSICGNWLVGSAGLLLSGIGLRCVDKDHLLVIADSNERKRYAGAHVVMMMMFRLRGCFMVGTS